MDVSSLKDYIVENDMVETILEAIGCHHISDKGTYISAANPDGDNYGAINVYKETLYTVNYTRDMSANKKSADIFDLVSYCQQCNFFESLKYVCEVCGLSVYHDFSEDLPESIQITQMLMQMLKTDGDEEDTDVPLKPLSEHILSYYDNCAVQPLIDDGISIAVQYEMQIGYDQYSDRITIPIRDVYGTLVGVKGRCFNKNVPENVSKYMYLERCNKGRVLYGLYRALPHISEHRRCYVVESEKGVLQGMTMGIDNIVACGGANISSYQIEMLSRLCCDIVICFDKDIKKDRLDSIAQQFIGSVNVYAMIDTLNILEEKESPTDSKEKFFEMNEKCITLLRAGGTHEV